MKTLIASDNHGDGEILIELAVKYQDEVDHFIHCGDSELKPTDTIWHIFSTVKGNMDFYPYDMEKVIATEAGPIVVVHGHLHNVKATDQTLVALAKAHQAQVVCYGHTHVMDHHETAGVHIVNPGSVRLPRGTYPYPTYAILEIIDEAVSVKFYNRDHQLVQ